MTTTPRSYAFGDSPTAARRLQLVAQTFAEPSRRLLATAAPSAPSIVIDLGCGPGHSTRLVHDVTGAHQTIGLDASDAFVRLARAKSPIGITYHCHDVRAVPFPTPPADLIYARLVLAHLPDPPALVAQWLTQVTSHGALVLDEIEYIHTDHPVLTRYEEMAVAVVVARGGPMYAGPLLADLQTGGDARITLNRIVAFDVAASTAAQMYGLNIVTWRNDPAIAQRWSSEEVDHVARGLRTLADSTAVEEPVHWGLRQVVIERGSR